MRDSAQLTRAVRASRRTARRAAAPGERRRLAGWLLLAAGAAYAAWLLEFLLPTGLSPVSGFVSEHYPVFQPYQQLFRAGDLVAGAGYLAAAWLLRRVLPSSGAAAVTWGSLIVFGAATIADAAFVPDCVSTVDPVCERREFAGQVSWHHLTHLAASATAQLAVIGVAFALSRLAARTGSRRGRALVRVLFVLWAVAGIGCLACYPFGLTGVPQRIQLLVMSAATIAAAVRCLRGNGRGPGGRKPSAQGPAALANRGRAARTGRTDMHRDEADRRSAKAGKARASREARPHQRRRADGLPAGAPRPRARHRVANSRTARHRFPAKPGTALDPP
ncbi:DUF998 domain-containing protein [Amycolatopsis sp. NPDC054798]